MIIEILAIIGGIFLWCLVGILSAIFINNLLGDDGVPIPWFAVCVGAPLVLALAIITLIILPIDYFMELNEDIKSIKKKLKLK